MKLEKFGFYVEGLSPLLCNNPASMDTELKPSSKKKVDPKVEAEARLYVSAKGELCIPSAQFRESLLYAVRGKKIGKRSAFAVFGAAVFCCEDLTILANPVSKRVYKSEVKEWGVDVRLAVVNKGRIPRARPRFEKWCCVVSFDIDTDMLAAEIIAENLNEAGKLSGVGDFRPSTGGGVFGRFDAKLVK